MKKSTKKARTMTVPQAKIKKRNAGTVKTPAPKKKTQVKAPVSKAQCSRTGPTDSPKSRKSVVAKTIPSTKPAHSSGKNGKSVTKRSRDRRHHRELSAGEYDVFVIQAAAQEKVSPKELVTVDRRQEKSSTFGKPVATQVPQSQEKQDRRQKVQRRRQIDPTTCERDYSQEEIEFMNALDEYKRNSGRMFPTCSEILEVFRNLGYAKLLQEEAMLLQEEIAVIGANHESGEVQISAIETGPTDDPQREPKLLRLET